jgi:branched-chain amino acid transport system substrate-binding protein
MSDKDLHDGDADQILTGKSVSRRQFLKIAGITGVAVGAAGGLGGLLAACGTKEESTTTTAAATPGSSETTATTAPPASSDTTVAAGPETGDEIKAGYVLPITGSMAAFGTAAQWHLDYFNKNIWGDGFVMGDGKKHKFTVMVEDMQSDSSRAGQLTGNLISQAGVQLIGASASADNVIPVRDTCESMGCPCITYDCPGDAWNGGQPEGGFKWCWHTWFAFKDVAANFINMWDQITTNKKVGGLYPNDGDGNAFAGGMPAAFVPLGYAYVDPGRYQDNTEDYSAIISQFRNEGVEIVTGVPTPPDFANFWKQAVQQGFHPKVSTEAKAMLFPQGINALGELGDGQTVECWFHPKFPYTSDVTGLSAQQICDLWEKEKGEQWTQPICFAGQFDVFTDILKRCKDPKDPNAIIEATKGTKLMTVGGPVDWTVNPDPYTGWNNFSTKPLAGGQWIRTPEGPYQYKMEIVASVSQTDIKTTAKVKELTYA